jgi:hypothetical protein
MISNIEHGLTENVQNVRSEKAGQVAVVVEFKPNTWR